MEDFEDKEGDETSECRFYSLLSILTVYSIAFGYSISSLIRIKRLFWIESGYSPIRIKCLFWI